MVTFRSLSLSLIFSIILFQLRAQSPAAKQVLQAETMRFEAMMHADTAKLSRMLAADLLYVHSNALKESKKDHLQSIGSKKLVYEKMEREEAMVRFYGKTALVNGTAKVRGMLNGNAFEIRMLYSATYRKTHGNWLLVNWQSTRIP